MRKPSLHSTIPHHLRYYHLRYQLSGPLTFLSPDIATRFRFIGYAHEPAHATPAFMRRLLEHLMQRMFKSSLKEPIPLSAVRGRVWRGESSMRSIRWAFLIFLGIFPLTARAQQAN